MTKARRAPRAQMQRRALAYRLAPWALPVSKRTRELITTGKPAIQAAYQALNELGPAPFVPEVSERDLSLLYHTAIVTLAGLELEPIAQPTEAERSQAWARARAKIGRELGAE